MSLAVLIPTFRRNDALERAIRSVWRQSLPPDQIVIADNDPEAGAKALVQTLSASSPMPLMYVHADTPGVANARNTGFGATTARFIAQLDDDESASEDWLKHLMEQRQALGAAVMFGPVTADVHTKSAVKRAYMQRLYSRSGPDRDQLLGKPCGCGNSLLDRDGLELPTPVFDTRANEIGGEDDLLFGHLGAHGAQFGWAHKAEVIEHVEDDRADWINLLQRSFAYGQGPSQSCLAADRAQWGKLIYWMGIGACQSFVFAVSIPLARLVSAHHAALCIDKSAQGLGKLFWPERLSPRFYGNATLAD